jgi:hypothetical protein
VDNIKTDLRGWDGMDWIDLAQDRDEWRAPVNMVMSCYANPQAGGPPLVGCPRLLIQYNYICRWVDNIKTDLRGWDGIDWIDLAQDRDEWKALVNMVMSLWVP